MATYTKYENQGIWKQQLKEQHIYGSSRLGYRQAIIDVDVLAPTNDYRRELGYKLYELSNHLGNVISVISDEKIAYDNGSGSVANYSPNVVSATDFYPFGMYMPGRSFSSRSYVYGFQGQEKDDEIKGEGNSINYKYRVHDPRLGRFLSVDPLAPDYPWNSTYAFSENRVIDGVELEGLEFKNANGNIANTNPTIGTPNMGLTNVEINYVMKLAENGLLQEATGTQQVTLADGTNLQLPVVPNNSTTGDFQTSQANFTNTYNPTNNDPNPWIERNGQIGLSQSTSALIGGTESDGDTYSIQDQLGNMSPALHNYFVQNAIQRAANGRTSNLSNQTREDRIINMVNPQDYNQLLNYRDQLRFDLYLFPIAISNKSTKDIMGLTKNDYDELGRNYPQNSIFYSVRTGKLFLRKVIY
jgi:RHS repeat-associated protein